MCKVKTPTSSLIEACRIEIDKHKWIESEKAGRDLGELAIRCWVRKHWNNYLREKWIEHLEGKNYWIELEANDFGLLKPLYEFSSHTGEVVQQLKLKGENLTILHWAIHKPLPDKEVEEVIQVLLALDINSRRMELKFENGLISPS